MTQRKLIVLAAFVALFGVVALAQPSFAREGSDDTAVETEKTETETETETKDSDEVYTERESSDDNVKFLSPSQKERFESRKQEIKQRLEGIKNERSEKLADKRLQTCQKRQSQINKIFASATERNQKQLAVFQAIEEKVKAFYVDKNLSAEGYAEAVAKADEKEAVAVAAVDASQTITFDCTTTDAAKPGSAIKEAMNVRHAALKDYRTAVKDLILVVKNHNGQQRTSDTSDTETEPTTREEQR